MSRWSSARSCELGSHLPPPDTSENLIVKKGKTCVKQQFDTPTDSFGVVDIPEAMHLVSSTISSEYDFPMRTNVHHAQYPRRVYEADPLSHEFREGSANMVEAPIQLHNLLHRSLIPPAIPDREVMVECVKEQRQHDRLYKLGTIAIRYQKWADRVDGRWSRGQISTDDALELIDYFTKMSVHHERQYLDYVEKCSETGSFRGIIPPRQELYDLRSIIPVLGKRAASGHIDAYRAIQERKKIVA